MAHYAIDVVGDYALPRDAYDNLRHGSRELVAGIALMLAVVLAARGLRSCCDIVASNRTKLQRPVFQLRQVLTVLAAAVTASALIVPAMEYLDGRLDGIPVPRLGDAFGGSVLLGLATTILCATFVTLLICAAARWLVSHRDSIVTIIETLLRRAVASDRAGRYNDVAQLFTPRRRRALNALRLSKRGPPAATFA